MKQLTGKDKKKKKKEKEIHYSKSHIVLPAVYNNGYLSGTQHSVDSEGIDTQQPPKGSKTEGSGGKRES